MQLKAKVLTRYDGKHVLCTGLGQTCGPDAAIGESDVLHDAAAAHSYRESLRILRKSMASLKDPFADTVVGLLDRLEVSVVERMERWGFKEPQRSGKEQEVE